MPGRKRNPHLDRDHAHGKELDEGGKRHRTLRAFHLHVLDLDGQGAIGRKTPRRVFQAAQPQSLRHAEHFFSISAIFAS